MITADLINMDAAVSEILPQMLTSDFSNWWLCIVFQSSLKSVFIFIIAAMWIPVTDF